MIGAYYTGKLKWLCQESARKGQGKLTRCVPLLQDNAPAHTSQVAIISATECGCELLPHAPYYTDMASSDFYLFPKLKSYLRGSHYGSNEGLIEAVN